MFQILAALIAIGVGPQGALAAEPHWPSSLTIGTAAPGGTYFVYGEALARMLSRELGILVSTRRRGAGRKPHSMEAGEIQLAFVTLGVALRHARAISDRRTEPRVTLH
jgi:TRAP-type uncharacterized transport system substrate-binding protein